MENRCNKNIIKYNFLMFLVIFINLLVYKYIFKFNNIIMLITWQV